MTGAINHLYNGHGYKLADKKTFTWDSEVEKKAIDYIYNGKADIKNGIEPHLYHATLDVLNEAVEQNFPNVEYGHPDYGFVHNLKHNNAVFAAFKTHRQQNDLAKLLTGPDGKPRSFHEFEKATRPVLDGYNRNWLQTEYNTAMARARFAANYRHALDNPAGGTKLKWVPSRSASPREAHKKLWGTVLPIDDPFWQTHQPGNIWNCKCDVVQTGEADHLPEGHGGTNAAPGLKGNPGLTAMIFSTDHPYYAHTYIKTKKLKLVAETKARSLNVFTKVKGYKSGGEVIVSNLFDKTKSDARTITDIAEVFARDMGEQVYINPTMLHFKNKDYGSIFKTEGTHFFKANPDLTVGGKLYEVESYKRPWGKRSLKNMLRHGFKQCDRIIIDVRESGVPNDKIVSYIKGWTEKKTEIQEVWTWTEKGLNRIY